MPTLLITGANRGLGLEFTKQYLADGWKVIACARHPEKSEELQKLKQAHPSLLELTSLDVTDLSAIEALGQKFKQTPIDLLISNAGIYGGDRQEFGSIDYLAWQEIFKTNTLASMKLAESFLDSIQLGQKKCFMAITSKMGSIADNTSGGYYLYRSSKAALNMVIKSLSVDWQPYGITCLVLHPGWVQTDMGGAQAPLKPTQSVKGMIQVLSKVSLADTGRFLDFQGKEILW